MRAKQLLALFVCGAGPLKHVIIVVAAALAIGADAQAATVSVSVDASSENVPRDRGFSLRAAPGESNDVTLVVRDKRLQVRDAGATLIAGEGCRSEGDGLVSCGQARVSYWAVDLGDGDDVLVVNSPLANATYDAGSGDDRITGSSGYETFSGGAGSDVLLGGAGFDLFFEADRAAPSLEADVYDGGPGSDEISYSGRSTGIAVDLAAGTGPGGDRLVDMESLDGGSGDDVILGSDRPGRLEGVAGNDRIEGRGGDDKLYGGPGSDVLLGGDGNDELVGEELDGPDGTDRLDGGAGNDLLDPGAPDELTCGQGRDRLVAAFEPLPAPLDCEELYSWASGRRGVAITAHPRRTGGRLAFGVRCLHARPTADDLPVPVRDIACRARLELRTYRPGHHTPGRLLARSRRVLLPPGGGTLTVAGVTARRVWAVITLPDSTATIATRLPRFVVSVQNRASGASILDVHRKLDTNARP
jgi:hypothetical protein